MFQEVAKPIASHSDLVTQVFAGLTTLAVAILGTVNHLKGKKGDERKSTALERIEKKIDANHAEVRRTCEQLWSRLNDVDAVATDALTHAVGPGPDHKNGLRSRVESLEEWRKEETERQRDELDRRRGLLPGDVGTLTPRNA